MLHDRRDRLWISVGESMCNAPGARLLAGLTNEWACDTIAGGFGRMRAVIETPSGRLWAASEQDGFFEYSNGWRRLPLPDLPIGADEESLFVVEYGPKGKQGGHDAVTVVRMRVP